VQGLICLVVVIKKKVERAANHVGGSFSLGGKGLFYQPIISINKTNLRFD
jgi:hypothetical protein